MSLSIPFGRLTLLFSSRFAGLCFHVFETHTSCFFINFWFLVNASGKGNYKIRFNERTIQMIPQKMRVCVLKITMSFGRTHNALTYIVLLVPAESDTHLNFRFNGNSAAMMKRANWIECISCESKQIFVIWFTVAFDDHGRLAVAISHKRRIQTSDWICFEASSTPQHSEMAN